MTGRKLSTVTRRTTVRLSVSVESANNRRLTYQDVLAARDRLERETGAWKDGAIVTAEIHPGTLTNIIYGLRQSGLGQEAFGRDGLTVKLNPSTGVPAAFPGPYTDTETVHVYTEQVTDELELGEGF